jgi:hypothetical protein
MFMKCKLKYFLKIFLVWTYFSVENCHFGAMQDSVRLFIYAYSYIYVLA